MPTTGQGGLTGTPRGSQPETHRTELSSLLRSQGLPERDPGGRRASGGKWGLGVSAISSGTVWVYLPPTTVFETHLLEVIMASTLT